MCNTCGCSAAEDFEAERRYRYGNRYITRDSKGRFKKNVDVGRSLSADRRRKAKTVKGVGQGGSGDYNAESNFDKLSNEIAEQYEKKGKSKEEAERIGKATAYKVGVAKYGKRGMERKARAGRAKSAETFEAYDDNISDRQEWLIGELGGKVDKSMNRSQASDYIKELQGKESGTWKDAEEFGAEASCGNCGNALVMNAEGEHSCGCGTEMGAEGERKERKSFAPKMHMITYEEILEEKKKNQNMKDAENIVEEVKDFDVVGTTQDVVSKTGFNIPTGVASIAVVFMAYMTGKKYGN